MSRDVDVLVAALERAAQEVRAHDCRGAAELRESIDEALTLARASARPVPGARPASEVAHEPRLRACIPMSEFVGMGQPAWTFAVNGEHSDFCNLLTTAIEADRLSRKPGKEAT